MESVKETKYSDIVITSIYGRGHWLAAECARRNWNVTLLELTPSEPYKAEDWEGPWGFFDGKDLLPSQREHLLAHAQVYPVRGGFTAWLPRGPLELTGPLADFQTHAFSLPEEVVSYLNENSNAEPASGATVEVPRKDQPIWVSKLTLKGLQEPDAMKGREGLRRKLQAMPFEKTWLANLAHTLASPVYRENTETMDFGAPLSLRAPFGVRHIAPESIESGLKSLEALGVRVRKLNDIYDVRVQSGHFESIVVDQNGDVEAGRAFVWMLSSNETTRFHERIMRSLYPYGALKPSYFWARFRFRLKGVSSAKSLPLAATLVESPFLPWSHSNLLVIKRVRDNGEMVPVDVWLRAPIRVMGDETYFNELKDQCQKILAARVPQSEPQLELLPAEIAEIPNSILRYPIFTEEEFSRLRVTQAQNLFVSTPEKWKAFDWNSQMRYQAAVHEALERLRAHWENVERRQREANT